MKAISIIIPAYMEAANIQSAVRNVIWALDEARVEDYELLIIDCLRRDGTHDGTPEIAESLAKQNSHVKVFHNPYVSLGTKYWLGVEAAKFPYVVLVPGDNELPRESLRDILSHLGEADILTTYTANMEVRPLIRRIISRTFTFLINFSTGLNLRYYNGDCVHRTEIVKQVKDRDDSFAYMAKLLTQLIKAGYSYKEIPITLQKRGGGKSAALKMGNFVSVGKTIFSLFWKYRILGSKNLMISKREE